MAGAGVLCVRFQLVDRPMWRKDEPGDLCRAWRSAEPEVLGGEEGGQEPHKVHADVEADGRLQASPEPKVGHRYHLDHRHE
jgi:hypothetical protein